MRSRLWLVAPAMILYTADVGLTLAGQPQAYWAGDSAAAVEYNPLVYPLLVRSPWLFAGVAAVWLAVLVVVVANWRHTASRWLAVLVAVAHAFGGASWLARSGPWGLAAAFVYLAVAVQAVTFCWRRSA